MKIFITDNDGNLIPVDGKSVVIELNNGKTIEIAEEYGRDDIPEGINLWGGREPSPSLPFEEIKARTESLGVYPIAANALHVFPYKISSKNES
ncbi:MULTISPECIES: hypothetical protein [Citrobacter]|uniref:Uncharacterized protein n=2 Tax=Citrobacter freundii complex TaxID=1344959 RepID=A0A9N8GSL9_9ENTR|nr:MULTISPECIES: hypothetical protein [Citrobacter]AHY12946.1 hypothetical protein CFNIH1_15885 [Citrobacter freundii CFNIH1]KAA0557148.1 hypothetical protein F0329_11880 [Citrobacter werkmanii]MBD0818229.1 hypothetical protein [Citrobacter sp. C5_2]MBJ8373863.1 hypothetical protein [Citrobacter cronae]MBQ4925084.1 hypothetical protein [Citrobacter werkmanii]